MVNKTLNKIKLLNPEYPNKSTGIINGKTSGLLNWNDIAYPQMYDSVSYTHLTLPTKSLV